MSKPYYVMRQGRRILVEDITPGVAKRQKGRREEFAMVPLARAAEVTRCMKRKGLMVWIVLVYLTWKNKSPTVQLSNEIMRRHGVSRRVKYRALTALEAGGIITVEWRGKRAPMVTLI